MITFAVIDQASGAILNRILLEHVSDWEPEEGYALVAEADCAYDIGGSYVGDVYTPPAVTAAEISPAPVQLLSQDLMAQFTTEDATKIQAAVNGNVGFWLLWSALQTQSAPMLVTNERFQQGWAALTSVLGAERMTEIAGRLSITL